MSEPHPVPFSTLKPGDWFRWVQGETTWQKTTEKTYRQVHPGLMPGPPVRLDVVNTWVIPLRKWTSPQ